MPSDYLFLTATITPPAGVPQLARLDPDQRRRDYLDALAFYLGPGAVGFERIYFVENSGADLSEFDALIAKHGMSAKARAVSLFGLDYPPAYGRGYGEFKLLHEFHSKVAPFDQIGAADRFWKVTGRYKIRNLAAVIAGAKWGEDLYCHLRNRPRRWADLYVLGYTRVGHAKLMEGIYTRFREDVTGLASELLFRTIVDDLMNLKSLNVAPRLAQTPEVDGIRGADNTNYLSADNLWKLRARKLANRLLPFVWI